MKDIGEKTFPPGGGANVLPGARPAASPAPAGVTQVLMVLDQSWSMEPVAADVRDSFNSYISGLHADAASYRVSLTVFNHDSHVRFTNTALADVPPLTEANYQPQGNTALFDAVGKTILGFERDTVVQPDDRVILVIQTDGEENSSKEFDAAAVRKLIEDRTSGGKWLVMYIGAKLDTWAQARSMGVRADAYMHTSGSAGSYGAVSTGLAAASARYSRTGDRGSTLEKMRGAVEGS